MGAVVPATTTGTARSLAPAASADRCVSPPPMCTGVPGANPVAAATAGSSPPALVPAARSSGSSDAGRPSAASRPSAQQRPATSSSWLIPAADRSLVTVPESL